MMQRRIGSFSERVLHELGNTSFELKTIADAKAWVAARKK